MKKATFKSLYEVMNIIAIHTVVSVDEKGVHTTQGITIADVFRKSQVVKSMACVNTMCAILKENNFATIKRSGRNRNIILTQRGLNFLRGMQDLYHNGGQNIFL